MRRRGRAWAQRLSANELVDVRDNSRRTHSCQKSRRASGHTGVHVCLLMRGTFGGSARTVGAPRCHETFFLRPFLLAAPCSLSATSDEQTEDGHAMMESDTFHSFQDLVHAARARHNSVLSLRVELKRKAHCTALNKCAPTSPPACTRHQRPTRKWYVDCEGAVVGCTKSGCNKYSVMDLGRDSPGLCLHCSRFIPFPIQSDVRTPVSRFCLKTFALPSWTWAILEVEAFIKKAPVTECSWSPQPNTFLVDTPNCQHCSSTLRCCWHLCSGN